MNKPTAKQILIGKIHDENLKKHVEPKKNVDYRNKKLLAKKSYSKTLKNLLSPGGNQNNKPALFKHDKVKNSRND